MSTLLSNQFLAHCVLVLSEPNTRWKWVIRKQNDTLRNFQAFQCNDGEIEISRFEAGKDLAATIGATGPTLAEWDKKLGQFLATGNVLVRDCTKCRHRLACTIMPETARLFESI